MCGFHVFLQFEVFWERLQTIRTIVGQSDGQVNNLHVILDFIVCSKSFSTLKTLHFLLLKFVLSVYKFDVSVEMVVSVEGLSAKATSEDTSLDQPVGIRPAR